MEALTVKQKDSIRINPQLFGLWIGIAAMMMMFGAFTSAYIVKHAAGNWLEFPIPNVFYISTALIVCSSLTLHLSYVGYQRQQELMYKGLLILTFLLGVGFVISQYVGWQELFGLGVDMKANVAGSFFYLITGAHAVHVLAGVACLVVAMIHAFTLKFRYTEKRKNRFQLIVHFWHFVDILWIYLLYFLLNN